MGKTLQIRVIAQTFSFKDAHKRWPGLYAIANLPKNKDQGVLTLIDRLYDLLHFGDIGQDQKQMLENGLSNILTTKEKLEDHLAERQAAEADKTSYILEDELDKLEKDISAL